MRIAIGIVALVVCGLIGGICYLQRDELKAFFNSSPESDPTAGE